MAFELNETTQQLFEKIRNFKFEVDEKVYQKVKSGIQIKSNFYLERVNNWILVSSGAMFSILYSGIDKHSTLIDDNSLRRILSFLVFVVIFSIIQKVFLTVYRVKCEHSVHKFERHFAKGTILNDSIQDLLKRQPDSDGFDNLVFRNYHDFELFNAMGRDFSLESNDVYNFGTTIHNIVISMMMLQALVFFVFMCSLVTMLWPQ